MLIPNINNVAAQRPAGDGSPTPAVVVPDTPAPAAAPPAAQAAAQPPTPAQIKAAMDDINKMLKQGDSGLQFSVDKETNRTVFKLVESETGEVIRQYPTEDMLAIARAIDQLEQQAKTQGLLLSKKA